MHRDKGVVLLTDRAWPDDDIERRILLDAGWHLVAGPADPVPATETEALVDRHNPVAIRTCWANVSADAIRRGSGSGSDARYLCLRSRCAQRQPGIPPALG